MKDRLPSPGAQPSLRDYEVVAAPFPALKRRATLKSRYAAEESNFKILDESDRTVRNKVEN